ncbi:sodium-coupled monocarboxylate transporter 2-like [Dermacentor variabilis]|uniref:sodium-coupled monocarboxylate transporter 2-like n=1 Tax=Dermacentor variabilis TaxID=34621 RepID=UPI003F5B8297
MTLMPLLLVQVHLVLVSAVRLEAEEHGAWPFSSKPWITSAISRLSSTRVHESSSIVGSMRGANHGWISEDRPIDFDQQDPRDADQGYIDTRCDGFVGFGAGTLADMTLMPLLLVQVHLVLVSAVRLEAEEHGAWPFSSKPWITSAISRLSSTRVHESSSIVGSMRGANHGWISEDRPIDFDQQDPRDADQGYIDTRRDGFVGFGAGTLADMTLMPLLLVQPSIADSEVFPENYVVYRKDRPTAGGGVFLLVHSSLQSSAIDYKCNALETAQTSALLLVLIYFTGLFLGVALTLWFRGCDPTLLGEISSIDQIVPYYINTYLMDVPGFSGLFLAGIVSAATSTVSSTVNSQAAILYVDVIAHRYKNAENHVLWITRGTALGLGILMTLYSMLCARMGSVTRAFLMVYNGITAPFVGLCLLAVLFPFVHSKGAGVATLSMVVYQLCHITTIIRSGRRPPRMEASLDSCPGNQSSIVSAINATFFDTHTVLEEPFVLFRMSYLWTSFFAIFATVIIGVAVSAVTGEMKNTTWQCHLCCDRAVAFWRKLIAPCPEQKVKCATTPNNSGKQHSQKHEVETLLTYTKETTI